MLLLLPPAMPPALAQGQATTRGAQGGGGGGQGYSIEQLDALLAPVALYPDALLTPLLIASTNPVQVVEAARWVAEPANAALKGDALARALEAATWDPGVKALVPFPQVLAMMSDQPAWMQQLGYAFATQQPEVLDSVQRLRRQAAATGNLTTTDQQAVRVEQGSVVVAPANPQVVYVPVYDPAVVYGSWPYAGAPPVALPPPPGYLVGSALLPGVAFAAGVGVVASLWNVATPNWHRGHVDVNVNRWNTINVSRPPIDAPQWRPPPPPGAGPWRPPVGPVGPARPGSGVPPNAVGRPSVAVPATLVQHSPPPGWPPAPPPAPPPGGPRANVQHPGPGGAAANHPPARIAPQAPQALGSMAQGGSAGQFSNRGQQSRQAEPSPPRPPAGDRAAHSNAGGNASHAGAAHWPP
jgi:hypothetical protein